MKIKCTKNTLFYGLETIKGDTCTGSIAVQYPTSKWIEDYGSLEKLTKTTSNIMEIEDSTFFTYTSVVVKCKNQEKVYDVDYNIELTIDKNETYKGRKILKFSKKYNAEIYKKIIRDFGKFKMTEMVLKNSIAVLVIEKIHEDIYINQEFKGKTKTLKQILNSNEKLNNNKILKIKGNTISVINYSNEVNKNVAKLVNILNDRVEILKGIKMDELELKLSKYFLQYLDIKSNENIDSENIKINQYILKRYDIAKFINSSEQIIIDGAPGTGKSHYVKNNIITNDDEFERVTFYPDYEYHNFVGSILPSVNDGEITYKFQQGHFTQVLDKALCNPEYNYYLVIEELTRGNAAAIFGDVFQLLDRCENGWSEYSISNENMFESLDNLSKEVLLEKNNGNRMITMPPNMSIICTVNSSDQNVYPLDTAFKRRFNYKIMDVNEFNVANDFKFIIGNCTEENLGYEIKSWKEFYQTLNSYMIKQMGLKEDKQIGPYFIKESLSHEEKCSKLCLYLWNDVNKVYTSSPNKIFDTSKVSTLSELNNLFLNGSRSEIINVLADEFKEVLKINI